MRKRCTPRESLRKIVTVVILPVLAATIGFAQGQSSPAPQEGQPATELYVIPTTGELVGTGAKRPTAEQLEWGDKNLVKTKKVKFNKLGMERINKNRSEKGRRPLPPTEMVSVGAEPTASSQVGPVTAVAAGSLPSYVNNSTLPYFPPIRSQGSLGSCAQFSAVHYTLTHMTALGRGWNAKSGGDTFRFSPKWTYNMVNGGVDSGSWHYDAYAIAIKHGLATWAEFPYDLNYRAWCLNPVAWRHALDFRAAQTGRISDVDAAAGLDQVKQLLVNGYILNFATYINSWQWKTLQNDPATTGDDAFAGKQCAYAVNGMIGGHAMTIVGYNDEVWVDLNSDGLVTANEKGALRIANSWGTGWVEAGFCWLAYDAIRTRNPAKTSEGIFWMDEATWVTARPSYSPQLIAEFSLNHLKRNQLQMSLGTGTTSAATPSATWSPARVLSSAGGPYAFDGTTIACNGTFCLDLTDLVAGTTGAKRFFVGMRDSTPGDVATLNSMKLVDVVHAKEVVCDTAPLYADATLVYATVDYDPDSGVLPPVAIADVSPMHVNIGDAVSYDGSSSYSPTATISSYLWDFGDGQISTGPVVQHAYSSAGNFAGDLTVTDTAGASSSAGFSVEVIDPSIINAPSGLTAKASGGVVTLKWVDNSNNETEFKIYRLAKSGKTMTQSGIGTVWADVTTYTEAPGAGAWYYKVCAANSTSQDTSAFTSTVSVRVR
jgi:hypothetical protein